MSLKIKLISCISAFILILGMFIAGVLSAQQAQVNIGGSISFNATDVYARVTGSVANAQSNPTLSDLLFTANDDSSPSETALATWSNMDLDFNQTPTPIEILITVENLSTERTLTVNLTNNLQGEGLNIAISRDSASYNSATNVELGTAGSNTNSTTFTLTLTVADPNKDLTDVNFGYILNMFDESYIPPTAVSSFTFSFNDTDHTATITDFIGDETEVIIPSTVNKLTDTTATEGTDYIVTGIDETFRNCSSLESVTIPESVTNIGSYTFWYCGNLTHVEFKGNSQLASIDGYAFGYCSSLETIQIPDGITSIEGWAFAYCSKLTSIIIPESVTSIGDFVFYDCSSLNSIDVDSANANYSSEDGVLFNKDKTTLITCPETKSGNYVIPDSVASINNYAFFGCSNLNSITIPEGIINIGFNTFESCSSLESITIPTSVTSIGSSAFSGCSSLESIIIPNKVTSIGDSAFRNCSNLASIVIGESVTSIGSQAFSYCINLTQITIPASVTNIGSSAFFLCSKLTSLTILGGVTSIGNSAFSGCNILSSITINATTPPTLGISAIPSVVTNIYVPSGSVDAYKAASGWSSYANIISAIE